MKKLLTFLKKNVHKISLSRKISCGFVAPVQNLEKTMIQFQKSPIQTGWRKDSWKERRLYFTGPLQLPHIFQK